MIAVENLTRRFGALTIAAFLIFLMGLALAAGAVQPVGYWDFEGALTDQSGHGNDGSASGGVSYSADHPAGIGGAQALQLALGGAVTVTNSSSLNTSNELTLAFWLKAADTAGPYDVIARKSGGTASNGGWQVTQNNAASQLRLRLDTDAAANQSTVLVDGAYPTSSPVWRHVAFRLRRGNVESFLDGVSVGYTVYDHGSKGLSGTANLIIGSSSSKFAGLIDDLAIWDVCLPSPTIAALAAGTCSPLSDPPEYTALAAWWRFEDDLKDATAFHNDAATTNTGIFSADAPTTGGGAHSLSLALGQSLTVAHSNSLDFDQTMSLALWIKANNVVGQTYDSVIRKIQTTSPSRGWNLRQKSDTNNLTLRVDTDGASNQSAGAGLDGVYPDSGAVWRHIALTLDHGAIKYYKDGALANSGTYNAGSQGFANTMDLLIGGTKFAGQLDEVALWGVVLPDSSIAGLASGLYTPATAPAPLTPPALIAVSGSDSGTTISTRLTGVNVVYPYESDATWAGDGLVNALRSAKCGVVRYPGGEVSSSWHWPKPTGRFNVDSWDPSFDGVYAAAKNWMNTTEYLSLAGRLECDTMIGVQVESGDKWGRIPESLDDATSHVHYCLDRGRRVKYWFIDNESYLPQTYQQLTVTSYANYVKQFGAAIKAVDPQAKIIVNWDPDTNFTGISTLLSIAGDVIDVYDMHNYWSHGTASWSKWLGQCPMTWAGGPTFVQHIANFRSKAAGHPNIQLAALEWNIGPNDTAGLPSPFQCGLMASEMLLQYIDGGLDMATFWPLHWNYSGTAGNRTYLKNNASLQPNMIHQAFQLYSTVLGQRRVPSSTGLARLRPLAARSQDGQTLWVYLLNKSNEGETADALVSVGAFAARQAQAVSLTAPDFMSDTGTSASVDVVEQPGGWYLTVPPHSLTLITFSTQAPTPSPSPTPTPGPSATASPSATPSPTPAPSPTPGPRPSKAARYNLLY